MAQFLLKTRLALELPKISAALERAENTLPQEVRPVCHHILASQGKRLRPFLAILFARLLGQKKDDIYDLSVSLEMLHAATLLHDDVLDNASQRRGKPSAHTIYPVTTTILSGDALLAAGNALVARFGNPDLSAAYSRATMATCAGEIAELSSQYSVDNTLDHYIAIITGKTAKLIGAACEMGAIYAHASNDERRASVRFGEAVGIAFQLVDDALDFAKEEETGKPAGGDLKEGKLTLPIRYYRDSLTENDRADFDAQFTQGKLSDALCQKSIESIRANGWDTKTRAYADTYLAQAIEALMTLPDREERGLVRDVTHFVRDRKK